MTTPLRVAVISGHELTRVGLTRLIELDPDRAQVVAVDEADCPVVSHDVTVYDLAGRVAREDDGLRDLVAAGSAVVVLQPRSGSDDTEIVLAMGAADVVPMDVTADALLASLERAAAGRRVAPGAVRARARAAARLDTGLTEREVAVLELIAAGLSNEQIASELFVSINTIKTYVRTAYRRIGADSRSQAVIWAMRQGLGPQVEPALMDTTDLAAALG